MDIQEIKKKNDLPNIAEIYGMELMRGSGNFTGKCPFHDERNPSLSIFLGHNDEWQFHCHGASCGVSGDVIDFVGLQIYGHSWDNRDKNMFREALTALGAPDKGSKRARGKPVWDVSDVKRKSNQKITKHIKYVWDIALGLYGDLLMKNRKALEYLYARGFTDKTIRKYRFGFCPDNGSGIEALAKLAGVTEEQLLTASILRKTGTERGVWIYEYMRGRIVFADYNRGFETINLIGRRFPFSSLPDHGRKFIGLAGFKKPVFGINRLHDKGELTFVVEAPWDKLTLEQWGFNAVAISGGYMSDAQAAALNRLRRPLIPVPDNDKGGESALAAWNKSVPGLEDALRIPAVVDGVDIKDANDLEIKLAAGIGKKVFIALAKSRGVSPRNIA